jgi:hypothetical protein
MRALSPSRCFLLAVSCLVLGCSGGAQTAPAPAAPKAYGLKIDNGAVGTPPANGKTLLAIYMIGSTLEDDAKPHNDVNDEDENGGPVKTGNGTKNLLQLVAGYNALSDAEKANVDVLVCLGGCRKASWQGVRDLDLPALVADAQDGMFGNGGPYAFSDPTADMSDDKTFQAFLRRVQARSAGAGKVMLELWDHGGAYIGVGPDSRHQGTTRLGLLGLGSIKAGLDATGFKGDLIGFDACLMANLEVANALKDHFGYLVASEELEPSHGWDYGLLVDTLGKQPMQPALELGKRIVDGFIESPLNQRSKARTLSVNDLSKVGAVTGSLDALTHIFRDRLVPEYQPVLDASGTAQHFGRDGEAGTEFSLDLRDFTAGVRAKSTDTQAQTAALDAATKAMVVYARESGEKPNSQGVSIFSPVNLQFFEARVYNDRVAATATWFDYLGKFVDRSKTGAGPTVSGEAPAARAAAFRGLLQAPALGAEDDGSYRMSIKADPGVARVAAMHVVQPDPAKNRYKVIASDRVDADPDGTYLLKGWDGTAIHLQDDHGADLLAPLTYETTTARGTRVYVAPGRVNGEEVNVYLEWDAAANAAVDQWVVPFHHQAGVAPRLQEPLEQGNAVAFYESTVDTDANGKTAELQQPITLASAPRWKAVHVDGQKLYFLFAQDLKGAITASPLHLVVELVPGGGFGF